MPRAIGWPFMNVARACVDFLAHCRVAKNLSAHSLRAYGIDLKEFERFVSPESDIAAIDRQQLRRYLSHLFETRRLKETSVKRRMACLKVMFRWLELDEAIPISPFHRLDVRIRLPKRLPRNLTEDEVRRLRRTALERVGLSGRITEAKALRVAKRTDPNAFTALVVLEVLLCTGLRVGELVSISVADIDLIERVITIMGKGSRQRRVFLPDDETAALVSAYHAATAARRGAHDGFVVTASGVPGTTQFVRSLLRETAQEAGISRRITPHMLRHTAATRLLENGLDIRLVQRLLGHQSISTTEIYTAVTDTSLKAAIGRAAARMKGDG
ncbi:tyrosine-type recombinase/integrase [Azospirillum brasilense]|uniref:Integrase n=1 Tax=Azospirillum brasilense TaxID=192 RepID=A0A6L3ASX6_AZOBR|nr:tyrosine-type recombinase/integrase [Azospirillum brasilense]KAA0678344.1 integrase [Azospirillum brasilense]